MERQQLPTKEAFLLKAAEYTQGEQLNEASIKIDKNDPRLLQAVMEVADESKSILKGLYYDFRKPSTSPLRKLKNFVLGKIANIVRNTLERPLLTQQKYNEQIYYLVERLYEQKSTMEKRIQELEDQLK